MDRLGYCLEVRRCVSCEKKLVLENNFLSFSRGGILCSNCSGKERKKTPIDNELIKIVRIFLGNKLENLWKVQISRSESQKLQIIRREMLAWFAGETFHV